MMADEDMAYVADLFDEMRKLTLEEMAEMARLLDSLQQLRFLVFLYDLPIAPILKSSVLEILRSPRGSRWAAAEFALELVAATDLVPGDEIEQSYKAALVRKRFVGVKK